MELQPQAVQAENVNGHILPRTLSPDLVTVEGQLIQLEVDLIDARCGLAPKSSAEALELQIQTLRNRYPEVGNQL